MIPSWRRAAWKAVAVAALTSQLAYLGGHHAVAQHADEAPLRMAWPAPEEHTLRPVIAPEPRAFWKPPQPAQAARFVQPIELPQPVETPQPVEPLPPITPWQPEEAVPERAAEGDSFAGPVPVERLVGYAVANNPRIQAAQYQARAMGARVPQAASLPDPQLMVNAFLEEIQTAAGPQEVTLNVSQKFPWFGKRALRSQVAYHDAMAAYARAMAVELEVIEELKRAYFDLYFVEKSIEETRKLQQPLEDVVETARTRYETNLPGAGLESVLQVQTELSKLSTSIIALEQTRVRARARLAAVLHLALVPPIEAVEPLARTGLAGQAENLVALIDGCQPELDAWRREVSRDQTSIALARREYWPDVTVGLNWFEIGPRGLSPVANGRDAFSLGVGVNLPIYRSRLDAAVREAQCETAASARRYASARDQFQAEVRQLYAEFLENEQVLAILEKEIEPRAEQTFELSTQAYRTGRLEFQQLIDAYRTLLEYRIDLRRREAMREQAIASLERAVGCAIATPAMD